MFGRLVGFATSGLTNLISKYAIRASIAIPFLFAFAFGLAGLTVILIDAFGYRDAYLICETAASQSSKSVCFRIFAGEEPYLKGGCSRKESWARAEVVARASKA